MRGFSGKLSTINAPSLAADGKASSDQILQTLTVEPTGIGPRCGANSAWRSEGIRAKTSNIIALADKDTREGYPEWNREAYLEYTRNGTRVNFERIIFERARQASHLAVAACVTGDPTYLRQLEKLLGSIADQPSWTLSATDPKLDNLFGRSFTVELNSAEMGGEIGQILYLLHGLLSQDIEARIKEKLEERVILPVFSQLQRARGPFWLYEANNWNAVCLSGFVSAVLTTIQDQKRRAQAIQIAEEFSQNYLRSFGSDGYAPEGITYWGYGFSRYSLLRAFILQSTKAQIDFFDRPEIIPIAEFPFRFEMAPGSVAAFGDAQKGKRPDEFTMAYANMAFNFETGARALPVNDGSIRFASLALFPQNNVLHSPSDPLKTGHFNLHDYFASGK